MNICGNECNLALGRVNENTTHPPITKSNGTSPQGVLTSTATSVPASLQPPPCREGKKREYPQTESSMNRKCLEASKHQPVVAGETPQASVHKLSYFSYSSEEMTMSVYLEWAVSAHTDLTTCVIVGAHSPSLVSGCGSRGLKVSIS